MGVFLPLPLEAIFGTGMGSGPSKPKTCSFEDLDKYCPAHMRTLVGKNNDAVDSSTDMSSKKSINSSSSGFHLLEIHSETMGLGIGAILALIAIIIVVVLIYKYCKSRSRRLREAREAAGSRYNNISLQPMIPSPAIAPTVSAPMSAPVLLAPPSAPPATKTEAFSRAIALLP